MIQGYPWPASALTEEDMKMLYHVRKSLSPKIPINRLIVQAVRATYMKIPSAAAAPATTTK